MNDVTGQLHLTDTRELDRNQQFNLL